MNVEITDLTRRFGRNQAVAGVSLQAGPGVFGLLGPNGAGKTTLLRMMATVIPPTTGRLRLLDRDPGAYGPRREVRRRLGYLPQNLGYYPGFTVAEFVEYFALLKEMPAARVPGAVATAIERVDLGGTAKAKLRTLSGGMLRRVGIAQAIVNDPELLLLDEPTAGLDPERRADMRGLIRALGAERAVLVSSHALAEVGTLCDRVVILHRGRVLFADTPARLAARLRPTSRIEVEAAAPAGALAATLAAVPGVRRVDLVTQTNGHARCRVEVEPGRDPRAELAARVTGSGWGLLALAPLETSLEEAFLALVASEEGTQR